jgi:hypothetical protein
LFGLSHREKIRIKYANKHTFQAVREEIKAQRSPDMILGGAVFFFLIFFGWDKF